MEDLKKFYEIERVEMDAGEEKPLPSHAVSIANGQSKPAKRKEQLEQQLIQVTGKAKELTDLMAKAQIKEGEAPDAPGRLEALGELVKQFYTYARKVKVNLQEALLDKDGHTLNKFAMKELDDEKGDAQMAKLAEHLEIAQRYFPHIELKEIASADDPPKRIAIVLGIDAEEFNAVVMAEKQRNLYIRELNEISKGILESNAAIETERALRKAAGPKTVMAKVTEKDPDGDVLVLH